MSAIPDSFSAACTTALQLAPASAVTIGLISMMGGGFSPPAAPVVEGLGKSCPDEPPAPDPTEPLVSGSPPPAEQPCNASAARTDPAAQRIGPVGLFTMPIPWIDDPTPCKPVHPHRVSWRDVSVVWRTVHVSQ